MDEDRDSGLSQEIIRTLMEQGIHSIDQLRSLAPEDVEILTLGSGFLPQRQIQQLLKFTTPPRAEEGHDTVEKRQNTIEKGPTTAQLGQDERNGRQETARVGEDQPQEKPRTTQCSSLLRTGNARPSSSTEDMLCFLLVERRAAEKALLETPFSEKNSFFINFPLDLFPPPVYAGKISARAGI